MFKRLIFIFLTNKTKKLAQAIFQQMFEQKENDK
jgi:hypothetical protein